MSAALDALLAELTPPPVPAGLARRVSAAARATVQEANHGRARRVGRDRRGRWRRGLVIGAGAFGLAVSSAVAATLAGVPLPAKVEAVIAKLPLVGKDMLEPTAQRPRPRAIERDVATPVMTATEPVVERPVPDLVKMHELRQMRRLAAAREIVAARRAAGLPTPRADRIERRLERRMEWWRQATPEQRQRIIELRHQRREARRARIEARRAAMVPPPDAPPVAAGGVDTMPPDIRPAYGPIDPRTVRAPGDDGHRLRWRELRAERLGRLRQQRLERAGMPTATRGAPTTTRPARRAPNPIRRAGLRPTSR